MERTIVGIDVGSDKICTLVGEIDGQGEIQVIGVGTVDAHGIRKGVVVNVAEATAAITSSVEAAERTSGYQIERAYVGLSGTHISSLNSRGVVGISRREQGIIEEDVDRVLDAAYAIAVPHNKEVIHVIPRGYVVDGQSGVQDPVGMHGFRLEVEAHIVTASSTAIQNLVKCVEGAGVEVDELVLTAIAAGGAVLSETEREMGVVLADMGAGTTDIAIFIEGSVWHTVTLGVGGEYITGDIAIGLRVPPPVAEQIKVAHGHARSALVTPEERFNVSEFDRENPQVVPRWKLADIVEARAEEMLSMIQQEIKRSGYDGLLSAGVVLCGGTAELNGMQELGRDIFGLPVRIGRPTGLVGLVDNVSNPRYATGVGLLRWGMTAQSRPQMRKREPSWGSKFVDWLKRAFLPD